MRFGDGQSRRLEKCRRGALVGMSVRTAKSSSGSDHDSLSNTVWMSRNSSSAFGCIGRHHRRILAEPRQRRVSWAQRLVASW